MGPAIALALWHNSGELSQRVVRYGVALVAGVVCAAVICAPVFLAGGGPNLLMAMGRLEAHDMLSGNT